jgi:hypothetical protein
MRLASIYRNLSVRHKLRLIVMATVTAALLCACAAVLVYLRIAAREGMRNDLEVMAQMLGANSTAALSFEDEKVGAEILSSLRVKRQIVAARILTAGAARWPVTGVYPRHLRRCRPRPRMACGLNLAG